MQPQLEACSHGSRIIYRTLKQHSQSEYDILGISLQLECLYLQRTFLRVITLMGPIKESLIETFFPDIFRGGGGELTLTLLKS